ncbi:AMP-binding protein [Sneathiella chungangensis]|uniref:3-methylmercaptopropionyl-CoA ligase n=1 Tax=Sneathiella chungangensis TaxID=1418234 RepID=A0A845MI28_9PROT|nr:class I adenylate-forming enzyme family protein [Sneathiella chungangensis]MZR22664.1 AMP-binding protein [Sneathiella chungangensis]
MTEWYPKKCIGNLVDDLARQMGGKTGLSFNGRKYTFAEMADHVDSAARALMSLGIQQGDHVAVWLNNSPDWLFLQYAISKIGAIIVPLNTRFRSHDIDYVLRQSDSKLLITHDVSGPIDYLALLKEAVKIPDNGTDITDPDFPSLKKIVILSDTKHSGTILWRDAKEAGKSINESELKERSEHVDPDDVTIILYTSGSTGFPKGVMHSHNIIRAMEERAYRLNITSKDVIINYMPLFHAFGLSEGSLMSMLTGSMQVLTENFIPDEALDLIEREKVTIMHGFDIQIKMLIDAQQKKPRRTDSLRFGWLPAGPSNVTPVARKAKDVFPTWKSLTGFGMTEIWTGACISALDDTEEQRFEASATPAMTSEVRVADPQTNEPLPAGVEGEIQIRGLTVTRGYYNKPKETKETFTEDGWLKSGDLGYFREDGHLRFVGRLKDMLKVGGENVDPMEVEGYILGLDGIQQISVVGVYDPRLGEVPIAYIQKKDNSSITKENIIEFCRNKLASYKIPKHIVFVDEYPMTASGKIRKVDLRQDAATRLSSNVQA